MALLGTAGLRFDRWLERPGWFVARAVDDDTSIPTA
jgi:hypothetical protein